MENASIGIYYKFRRFNHPDSDFEWSKLDKMKLNSNIFDRNQSDSIQSNQFITEIIGLFEDLAEYTQ